MKSITNLMFGFMFLFVFTDLLIAALAIHDLAPRQAKSALWIPNEQT